MKASSRSVNGVEVIKLDGKITIGSGDQQLREVIGNAISSGKNNTTELKLKQFIISGTFDDGFPLRLMAKDVRTADDMAHALGIATPLADLCAGLWDAAARELNAKANHTEMMRYMERLPKS